VSIPMALCGQVMASVRQTKQPDEHAKLWE